MTIHGLTLCGSFLASVGDPHPPAKISQAERDGVVYGEAPFVDDFLDRFMKLPVKGARKAPPRVGVDLPGDFLSAFPPVESPVVPDLKSVLMPAVVQAEDKGRSES